MGHGGRLSLCLFLAFALILCSASARHTMLLSEDVEVGMEGRSLLVTTNDYGDTTANPGHDPSRGTFEDANNGQNG
ncbi:protein PSY3 [Ziziphus jujuba]|uniref:Protein PSY3 n=1 Tax=Ziziphus jujuba TaxID=326968 RepID=A0ABM3IBS5_ZIZJJ|nr:protein PSY3-like [Ziziphus jujuba var. spinosa]XP_048325161.1 protein PSY3 [Ziziphus jujuba]